MLLLRLVDALRSRRTPYAVVGGYAVALHGAVRGTVDIDLVLKLSERYFLAAERALSSIGLQPRLPVSAVEVFRFRREYIENRNLTAWTFVNPSAPSEIVDVILTHDLAKMKIVRKRIRGTTVRLASIDDLIAMKKQSGRPQDVEDIKALERLQ
jgi:hypothetical protein